MFPATFFDFNGVLVNDEVVHFETFREVLAGLGVTLSEHDYLHRYLGFDDDALYAAFEFDDPNPRAIRSPLGDHDHVSGNTTDYGGVILDTRNDGHSAVLLLASAAGIQYDAVTDDDGSGEDASPDFFWEAAAHSSSLC